MRRNGGGPWVKGAARQSLAGVLQRAPGLLLSLGLALCSALVQAQNTASEDKLRQILERAQADRRVAGPSSGAASQPRKALEPEQVSLRNTWLREAEAALSRRDVDQAEVLFDRAANLAHQADTEIGLVRTYMQAGAYRRALAFGAHTAGVHLDVVGGSALYAWLLQAGGQEAVAQRLLNDTLARQPDNDFILAVAKQLRSSKPLADAALQLVPTRLAPYGDMQGLPAHARVTGSAVLLSDGVHALAPLALLPASGKVWVRNGLGQLSTARIQKRHRAWGVAVLSLERALPVMQGLQSPTGPVFPGSAGYALEYVTHGDASAAWPMLRVGFIGAPVGNGVQLALGVELKDGSGGGPVFDAAGRLLGLAVAAPQAGPPRLVSAQNLQHLLDQPLAPPAPSGPAPRAMLDQLYEAGLKTALQLITAR